MNESAIDSILVQNAGLKSVNEIAEETGLEPEEVARRTQAIFDRVMLTPEQQLAKNVYLYQKIANANIEAMEMANPEDVARTGNTAAGSLGRLAKEVEALTKLQNANTEERDMAIARKLQDIVETAYHRQLGKLEERYPDIPQSELKSEFSTLLVQVAIEADQE